VHDTLETSSLWSPVLLTLQLATYTTVILLLIATPLAWWLARSTSRVKPAVESVVALPLVLPPTVLGFYLLIALGPHGLIGAPWLALTGDSLSFSFTGLVIGSVLYSMPFVVQPLQTAFAATGEQLLEAAAMLRASPRDRFFSIVLPAARKGFIIAATLGFAHTVGEFGVILMIGGNIPGKTQVLSIAIYDRVETLQYGEAHAMAAGLLLFSFAALLLVYGLNRRTRAGSVQ
jgi:molybdate transport system permease protein